MSVSLNEAALASDDFNGAQCKIKLQIYKDFG